MKLSDYIKGDRWGKEANRLEKEALTDPFLSDAMDGYMGLDGDPMPDIQKLQKQITARTSRSRDHYQVWSVAAVLLILLATGAYFLMNPVVGEGLDYSIAYSQPYHFAPEDHTDEYIVSEPSSSLAMRDYDEAEEFARRLVQAEMVKEDSHEVSPVGEGEPIPLFAFPVPVGGEKFIEPYLSYINGEYPTLPIRMSMKVDPLEKPEPVVDTRSYKQYLSNHIQIPIEGACVSTKGKVTVSFRVNPSGRPYNIRVIDGLCESLDKEAIRLIQEGPDWKFGAQEVKMTIQL